MEQMYREGTEARTSHSDAGGEAPAGSNLCHDLLRVDQLSNECGGWKCFENSNVHYDPRGGTRNLGHGIRDCRQKRQK